MSNPSFGEVFRSEKGVRMRKVVIIGGAVALAGVSAALYSRSISHKDKDYKTVAVTKGPVVEKALAVGAM